MQRLLFGAYVSNVNIFFKTILQVSRMKSVYMQYLYVENIKTMGCITKLDFRYFPQLRLIQTSCSRK